jgi:hypothetical protein
MSDVITMNDFLDVFDICIKEHHDMAVTLSRETNFFSAMDEFAGYATRNKVQHYLDDEVFINHYNRVLQKAQTRDADVRMNGMKNIPNTKYFFNTCQ